MRKIYTKTVFEFNPITDKFEVNESESEHHFISDDAPMAMMKGGGDEGDNPFSKINQTTKTEPWGPQRDYLKRGFGEAQNAFLDTPNNYFPGQMVGDFSPETMAGMNGILGRAQAGSPLNKEAQAMLMGTLRGDYLTGGAGFNKAMDAASNYIMPKVDSQFASRGRSGSGLAAEAKTSALGDAFAKTFEGERANQMRAGALAPSLSASDYADFDRMMGVGGLKDAHNQAGIDAEMQRYDYNNNSRRNAIIAYMNAVNGNFGGETNQNGTTTTGGGSSGLKGWQRYLAGAGGGAAQGFAMGGPWGAAAGAGMGLLGAM